MNLRPMTDVEKRAAAKAFVKASNCLEVHQ